MNDFKLLYIPCGRGVVALIDSVEEAKITEGGDIVEFLPDITVVESEKQINVKPEVLYNCSQ